ncbi:MAG: PQQ-binding-like beta-propeller repeat protein [Planctomycetes bacterium]|nr:PQQ-binding-like beta-propeller repeat protein [Planctomycetota bacterium]
MTTRRLARFALTCWCACIALSRPARAQDEQPDVPGSIDSNVLVPHSVLDSKVVRITLQQASTWVKTGQYALACTGLQDIIDRYPNHLVNLGNGIFRGAHDYAVEILLTQLPPEGLAIYREKYDAEAKATLDRAFAERDPARIQQMLLRFAATSYADDALDALAALYLERGDAAESLYFFDEITRRFEGSPFDSPLRLAKVGYCHAALGNGPAVQADLETARRRFPDASMRVNGSDVKLAEYLQDRARAAASLVRSAPETGWERLGGDNPNARLQSNVSGEMEKQWHAELAFETQREPQFDSFGMSDIIPDEPVAPYYPAISGGNLIVHNGLWVESLNLFNGKRRWSFHGPCDQGTSPQPDARQSFSPTVADGIVYVNLEVPVETRSRYYRVTPIIIPIPERKLFALRAETGEPIWRHDHFEASSVEEDLFIRKASISSAPLVWRDLVIAGGSFFEGKVHSYLCGFDRMTGHLRWKTLICTGQQELNMFGQPWREHVTSPLAERDGVVYVSTNLGYVAAVDARNGLIRWVSEYPQVPLPVNRNYQPQARNLSWLNNPPILVEDTLYTTPLDSPDLVALDRRSGTPKWRWPRSQKTRYLLGATVGGSQPVLVLAGQGIEFVDPQTGRTRSLGTNTRGAAIGRGGIAPGAILVPNDAGLSLYSPETGRAIGEPRHWTSSNEGGNVLSVDGFLVIVSEKEASVHYHWDELFQRLKRDIDSSPSDPRPLLRLADAFEQGGKLDDAADAYRRAEQLARGLSGVESETVARDARRGLYQVYENLGQRALLAGDWDRAAKSLTEESNYAYDDETRIRALLAFERYYRSKSDEAGLVKTFRTMLEQSADTLYDFYGDHAPVPAGLYACLSLAEFHRDAKHARDAVSAFQDVIRRFPRVRFRGVEAGRFAKDQIDVLVASAGADAYAPFEEQARAQFVRAKEHRDETGLRRILDEFPNSTVTEECLLDLARLLKEAGRRKEGVNAFRGFLQSFPSSRLRPDVIADVADAYESEGRSATAAAVLRYLADEHGSDSVTVDGAKVGVAAFVREKLRRAPPELPDIPTLPLVAPVKELWKRGYAGSSNIAFAQVEGSSLPFLADHFFFISNRSVTCANASDGEPVWTLSSLGDPPKEKFVLQDGVLVVTTVREAVAVRVTTGEELWRTSTDGYIKSVKPGTATFVLSVEIPSGINAPGGTGTSHVLRALDLMTGTVVWERTLPGRSPSDPGTLGRIVWTNSMPVPGHPLISLFDSFTGKSVWTIEPPSDPKTQTYALDAIGVGGTQLALFWNPNQANTLRLYDVAERKLKWETSLKGFVWPRMQRVGSDLALFLRPMPGRDTANRPQTCVVQLRSGATGEVLFQREIPGDGVLNPVVMATPDDPSPAAARPASLFFSRMDPKDQRTVIVAVDSTTGAVRFEKPLDRGQQVKRLHLAGPTVVCETFPQTENEQRLVVLILDSMTGEPKQPDLSFDLSGSIGPDVSLVGGTLCIAMGSRIYCYGR